MVAPAQVRSRNLKSQSAWISEISIPFHVEYYDLDETYKDFVKILLTVHKRVYDMKHKMDIWFFQEEKNMKNISTKNTKVSAWKISQGGGKCPGGICPRG